LFGNSKHICDGRNNTRRVGYGAEVHEPATVGEITRELGSNMESQAGLATAAGTQEADKAHTWAPQEAQSRIDLSLSPNETG
jgi:hypothetical protein